MAKKTKGVWFELTRQARRDMDLDGGAVRFLKGVPVLVTNEIDIRRLRGMSGNFIEREAPEAVPAVGKDGESEGPITKAKPAAPKTAIQTPKKAAEKADPKKKAPAKAKKKASAKKK